MSKPNIFIFDDVQSELDYLEEVLNASGYLAVPAKNRKHFFGLLSRFSADLILLDIVMPNENGFSICEELKSHPKYKSIPIIFLTALTKNQDIKKGLELGAIDFISKPFNKEILLLRIKSVLQQFAQTKKYEMLFESMNNAFSVQRIITDENNKPIDYEFVEVNSVAASRFGLPRDELVGVRIKTIFPKFENKWLELFGRVALSQKAETKVDYSEEFNSYYHVHVFSPQKGYFATTFTDITEYVKVEKALKESEEKYRVIANNISDWVWKADLNLNFTYASPAVSKIRGLSVQEALSQSVEEAFPKESIQIMKAALKENLLRIENNNSKGWDPVTLEIQLYKKDKTKTWVQINARFIRDENKKPIEIIGVARDIDKQKKAELALSENEKRYRSLFESAVDPVLLMEGDQFIECNQKTIDVLGLKHKKDLLEKKPWELAPKFQPDGSLSIEKGKNAINQVVKKGHTTIDCIYLHRSGRPIWFHMSMARVRLKGKIYIYSIWRDITSKKTAEIALKESEEKYRLITDNISDLVWKSDMNLSFTYISPSVKKQRGFSQSEAMKQDFKEVVTPKDHDRIVKLLHDRLKLIEKGDKAGWETVVLELQLYKKDRSLLWVQVSARFIQDEKGKPTEIIGVSRDISKIKEAEFKLVKSQEALIKSNKDKDRFISILSHDLVGTIGSSMQVIEMLEKKGLSWPKRNKFIDYLFENSRSAYYLLSDLVKWGKASLGKAKVTPTKIKAVDVINKVSKLYSIQLSQKQIVISNNCPPNLSLFTDENILETILRNIIKNAIKYSFHKGKIVVTANVDENNLLWSIKDEGVGMTRDKARSLFSMDDMRSVPGTEGEQGNGIGLQIVKEYVALLGGKIWAESELNKGTSIFFTTQNSIDD